MKENPHLACSSCEKSIHATPHTLLSPGDLLLVAILSPFSPVSHCFLWSRALLQLWISWKSLWNLTLQVGRAPFQVLEASPMMKRSIAPVGYCVLPLGQAFRRPWCLLDVSSGILTPLTQLAVADCSYVMFNSWITINAICLEALILRENVFWVLKLNTEHFF